MRPNERLAAANLDQFLSVYMEGEPTPPPDNVDPSDTACAVELVSLAANIQPDPEFARNLEAQLLSAAVAGYTQPSIATPAVDVGQKGMRPSWKQPIRQWIAGGVRTQPVRRSSQIRLIQMVLAIILALVVLPVLGQTILRYFVPREVDPLPPGVGTYQPGEIPQTVVAATVPPISTATVLDEEKIEQIEQSINFSLLVPSYIPNECYWQSHRAIPNGVQLSYTCLYINQQQVQNVQQPRFGEGSIEEVSVGNNPAFYISGSWMQLEGQNEPIWVEDAGSWLIFEHNDITIVLRTGSLTKEEMIRIAESMLE